MGSATRQQEVLEELRRQIRRMERRPARREGVLACGSSEVEALLPGGVYPENPFTRAPTVVPWNADPADPGEISITSLPGGGYTLKARGLVAMLEPDIVVGD